MAVRRRRALSCAQHGTGVRPHAGSAWQHPISAFAFRPAAEDYLLGVQTKNVGIKL
jgi:hypothetical protein